MNCISAQGSESQSCVIIRTSCDHGVRKGSFRGLQSSSLVTWSEIMKTQGPRGLSVSRAGRCPAPAYPAPPHTFSCQHASSLVSTFGRLPHSASSRSGQRRHSSTYSAPSGLPLHSVAFHIFTPFQRGQTTTIPSSCANILLAHQKVPVFFIFYGLLS